MFSKGPPGSEHLLIDDKKWQQLLLRIDSFLDQQYAAVDRDNESDEWDILEVERWDPWLESRQAKGAQAPDLKVASTLFESYSGNAGFDDRDSEFKSIWEVDWLETGPAAEDAKKKMVVDWLADQRQRRQRKHHIRSRSLDSDSDSALRSDDLRPLRHSRSLQEHDLLSLRHFDSFDTALFSDFAGADLDDGLGVRDCSGHEEDMDEDALPESGSMGVVFTSNKSRLTSEGHGLRDSAADPGLKD